MASPPEQDWFSSSAILELLLSAIGGAISAIATIFYWGGGTRAELQALKESQAKIEADIRDIRQLSLQILLKHRGEE